MIYTPKYCCHCGDKIERTKQTIFSSSRFCEICQTDFVVQEWAPRAVVVFGLILSIVGVFGYFQPADKPLKTASHRALEQAPETKRNAANQSANEKTAVNSFANAVPPQNAVSTAAAPPRQNASAAKQELSAKSQEKLADDNSPTYFCGAATKKGAPCSRRVKGGGRCWQHVGQTAILPPDKLLASR